MNNLPYTVWRDLGLTGEGSNVQFDVAVNAKAKYANNYPQEVAHELLALRLGIAIGLPIPNGVPLTLNGKRCWASFSVSAERLPRATKRDIAAILANERLACGIIVFDSWILNQDRWGKNIARDRRNENIYIFDHGRAFGAGQPALLEKNRNCIGIDSHVHCLCEIRSLQWFAYWHERIMEIPQAYIEESVALATREGMKQEDGTILLAYLLDRRRRLPKNFRDGRHHYFTQLDSTLIDPFADRLHCF